MELLATFGNFKDPKVTEMLISKYPKPQNFANWPV